jgi:outer membrane protein assembly factor BamB
VVIFIHWILAEKLDGPFILRGKIYSSPALTDKGVCFMGGDGICYSLELNDGSLLWKKDLKKGFWDSNYQKLINTILYLPYTLNLKRKMNMDTKSWTSPLIVGHLILVTGFGKGLYAFTFSGEEVWSYDLGFPRYQLSGLVADEVNRVYCAARSGTVFCFDLEGKVIWKKSMRPGWHSWGNPSYNTFLKQVYFIFSKGEKKGIICATDKKGNLLWEIDLHGASHGSAAVSEDGKRIYICDFEGYLYKIDAMNGNIDKDVKVSSAVRALWTTPTIDSEGCVYLTTKDGFNSGRVMKFSKELNKIWENHTNKTLSVPVILSNGDVCFGSWDGYYHCLQTL